MHTAARMKTLSSLAVLICLALTACSDDSGGADMAACPATTCGGGQVFNRTTCACEAAPVDMAKHD